VDELIRLARKARENAYAPYSNYRVGAAIEGEDGRLWSGANFENVSFGATICAERAAVAQMIVAGGREIKRMAVATHDGGTPCGICLQVLREFAPDPQRLEIVVAAEDGGNQIFTLSQLLPFGFGSSEVSRT